MTNSFENRRPDLDHLPMNRESLTAILNKRGKEEALRVARNVRDDIDAFIEREVRRARNESSSGMQLNWERELAGWREKLADIEDFISELEGEDSK